MRGEKERKIDERKVFILEKNEKVDAYETEKLKTK